MSSVPSFVGFFEHPVDYISTLASGVSLDLYSAITGMHSDSIQAAAVRASGIDPSTGKPIGTNFSALQAQGVDPSDPNSIANYASSVAADAQRFYDAQLALNQQQLDNMSIFTGEPGSSFSTGTILLLLVGLLILFIVLEEFA